MYTFFNLKKSHLKNAALQDNDKEPDLVESGYTLIASSEAEDIFSTCSLPEQPFFFFTDKVEWQELRRFPIGRCLQGLKWINVIAREITPIHPYYSLVFR